MSFKFLLLFLPCLLWILFVPAAYLLTLNENLFVFWLERMAQTSRWFLPFYAAFELFLLPTLLFFSLRFLHNSPRLHPHYFPFLAGLIYGLWATTLFLTLPYIGGYPSLPSTLLASLLSQGQNQGPTYYLTVVISNLLLSPLAAWLLFKKSSRRMRLAAP